ncbi:comitin-like [Bolinopsis microptera]|uniref:comitin-like n=1 Tax=Bolinopsis microptera TaxID=2820187 RepID=UPI00307A502E
MIMFKATLSTLLALVFALATSDDGTCNGNIGGCCTDVECFQGDKAFKALALGTQLTSANGKYELKMQTNGNLVLYCNKPWLGVLVPKKIWSSKTFNSNGLFFLASSNLVIYNVTTGDYWVSGTENTDGNRLKVQDGGNVVLYNANTEIVWSTGTAGEC